MIGENIIRSRDGARVRVEKGSGEKMRSWRSCKAQSTLGVGEGILSSSFFAGRKASGGTGTGGSPELASGCRLHCRP